MLTSRLWDWLCPSQDLTALSQYELELRAGDGERDRTYAKVGRLGNRSCEPRIRLGTKCSLSSTPSCSVLLAGSQGARAVPSMGHSVSASAGGGGGGGGVRKQAGYGPGSRELHRNPCPTG